MKTNEIETFFINLPEWVKAIVFGEIIAINVIIIALIVTYIYLSAKIKSLKKQTKNE